MWRQVIPDRTLRRLFFNIYCKKPCLLSVRQTKSLKTISSILFRKGSKLLLMCADLDSEAAGLP